MESKKILEGTQKHPGHPHEPCGPQLLTSSCLGGRVDGARLLMSVGRQEETSCVGRRGLCGCCHEGIEGLLSGMWWMFLLMLLRKSS